jgi:hypothetical protein
MRKTPTTNIGYNNKKNAITNISTTKQSQNNGNGITIVATNNEKNATMEKNFKL